MSARDIDLCENETCCILGAVTLLLGTLLSDTNLRNLNLVIALLPRPYKLR
jgi:hypothetical protein